MPDALAVQEFVIVRSQHYNQSRPTDLARIRTFSTMPIAMIVVVEQCCAGQKVMAPQLRSIVARLASIPQFDGQSLTGY